jgi:sarcosine oxidase subunit alpha
MLHTEVAVIGGGPAGMSAAIAAAKQGARVVLFERGLKLGGQLVKQTHRFFGSEHEYAGTRGIDIATILQEMIESNKLIEVKTDTTVLGIYKDGVITYEERYEYGRMTAEKVIITTGAAEKMLLFPNNDLPGVYGAGAVQTFMNQFGVKPGDKVLMVGAGNIGLIVSYQLVQAGVKVEAIIDAAPKVGGYLVHAAKLQRLGVPIYTQTTIKEALGREVIEGAVIHEVDASFAPIQGTERTIDIDTICLAVGLTPLSELLRHVGCALKYVPILGGYVPIKDLYMETSAKGVYVAGDVACIEEASAAMIEGSIAGVSAAMALGYTKDGEAARQHYIQELQGMRSGAVGEKIRQGLDQLCG